MHYKVSVIVPVYNGEQFVESCCEQLVNQTLKALEIIFVDDGSFDDSGKLIDKCAERYKNVIALHQPNQGVSAARNLGLTIAQGSYIGFMDVDDSIDSDMYELLFSKSMKYNLNVLSMEPVGKQRQIKIFDDKEEWLASFFQSKIRMSVCNKLFSHDVMKNDSFPSGKHIHEDLYATYNALSKSNRVGIVNIDKYHYIQREGSSSREVLFTEKYFDAIKIADWLYEDAISNYPGLKKQAEMRKVRTYLRISKIYYLRKAPKEYENLIVELKKYLKGLSFRQVSEYFIKTDKVRYYLYLYAKPLFLLMIKTVDTK